MVIVVGTTLPEVISGPDPGPIDAALGALVATLLLLNAAVAMPWGKRKIAAAFWDKIGPNRIGPWGLLIIIADTVRLLSKELIVPEAADRPAFDLAPVVMMVAGISGFAVIPMGAIFGVPLQLADPEIGLAYVFAVSGLATLGLVMGGYASANKFALLGSLRAVASTLSYVIPLC